MASYSTNNLLAGIQQNLSSSYQTQLSFNAATGANTLRRATIFRLVFGADGTLNTSTNTPIVWDISRMTALGTATNATPNPLDGADTAAGMTASVNYTAEPTVSNSVFSYTLNQRNTKQWVARDSKAALVIPATNANGLAIRALSPFYTSTVDVTTFHAE